MKDAGTFAWQALTLAVVALLLFGLGLKIRDGELAAFVVGPSLIAPAVSWARRRFSRAS